MSQDQRISAVVTITSKGLDGTSVAKTFSQVKGINIDYWDGSINIIDVSGSFYFPITLVTIVTYVIAGTTHTIVMS